MQCESEITCKLENNEALKAFCDAIELINYAAFSSDGEPKIIEADSIFTQLGLPSASKPIEKALRQNKTVIMINVDGKKVSFEIVSRDYLDDLYLVFFELLSQLKAKKIKCEAYSSYGQKILKYKKGEVLEESSEELL